MVKVLENADLLINKLLGAIYNVMTTIDKGKEKDCAKRTKLNSFLKERFHPKCLLEKEKKVN